MQILDKNKENKIWPLFRLGFRVFFLGGALFSAFAMLLWILSLSGYSVLSGVSNPIWWHAHEMLFGFALAIVAGFVTTAMQNWTGVPGIKSWPLAIVSGLWLLPRLLMPLRGELNGLVILLDLLWLPIVAGMLARPILKTKQWRNLFFVPLFVFFSLLNALSYYGAVSGNWLLSERVFITTVLALTALITVMGGRVFPFFTARATQSPKIEPLVWLEKLSLVSIWLVVFAWLLLPRSSGANTLLALLFIVAGVAHLIRLSRWNYQLVSSVPLLWILYIGYLFIPLGLLVMAAALLKWGVTISLASHWLTAGALGAVVLGMIARVSLGHSGRVLEIRGLMVVAFVFMILAGVLRGLLPMIVPSMTMQAYHSSAACWIIAYGLFCWVYWPILSKPRIDGHPG
ncbi:NnrS family protein [Oceanisphaera avium]|uniref:Heme-Cu protein NnrS n=1 Tax=Oceanisphaera avium TaxID=1903694 RepID=A0A1Y0CYS6_9GAMM|nr:NnrS family protein [Oceanisphaera avium]ART80036.1 heme-Cu protein NnrS [Oceanisphaera avium]